MTASDNGNIGLRRVKRLKKTLNLSGSSTAVTKTVNNLMNCKKKIASKIIPMKIGASYIWEKKYLVPSSPGASPESRWIEKHINETSRSC